MNVENFHSAIRLNPHWTSCYSTWKQNFTDDYGLFHYLTLQHPDSARDMSCVQRGAFNRSTWRPKTLMPHRPNWSKWHRTTVISAQCIMQTVLILHFYRNQCWWLSKVMWFGLWTLQNTKIGCRPDWIIHEARKTVLDSGHPIIEYLQTAAHHTAHAMAVSFGRYCTVQAFN